MVVHVSCKPGHCYKFSPSPNTGDFCWSSNFVSALSSSQSNKKKRIEAETEINTLCCCPPIFCVDFLICRNCRMYLFNLQSYLKNYTLCTPYPPMIVPCWCASYLSKLLNVFVSIEKFAKLVQQSTHFATPPSTNHCSTNFFRKHSALIEKFSFAKENSNFMPKIKVLCIVLAGVDFGMSYDVSANMVGLFLQQFKHRQKQSHSLIMTMMVIIIVMRS